MDNGIYIALSKQLALFRDMAATANNIANTNTTGYNSEHMLFTSYLDKDVSQKQPNDMTFAYDISTYRNTENGSIKITGGQFDFAIQGDGYFSVETPLGARYTRAGNFQIDPGGQLISAEGYPVLDPSGQRIIFPENMKSVEIGETGKLKVDGEEFSAVGVFSFANEQLMERLNGRLFKSEVAPQVLETARVMQGSLESANVKPVLEMTHMMEVSKGVSGTAKYIEIMYELQRKTNNIWAQQG